VNSRKYEVQVDHNSAPPIAVDLFLSVTFLFANRWIKRNPSSFLRYLLFPFGGLNVERWPRILLTIVRVCAVLGFFAFLLAFVDLLAPESVAHPTSAVLYTKFAACIVISFFALRGTAEQVDFDETPEARPLASSPSPGFKTVPAAPKPAPPKAAAPATKKPTPAPVAYQPSPDGARPAAPATGAVPSRLVHVEAPPVPNRSNPLTPPPPGVVRERLATVGSTFLMGVIFVAFFYFLGAQWLVIALLCFFTIALVVLFFGRNALVGACPFCGGLIERYNRLRSEPVRCGQCNEISKFENEQFSPYDPNAVSETAIFRSPLFENALWPNGCVLCGAPPVRFDEAKAVCYQARRLATPLVSSVWLPHPAARATGVPYCALHREAIQVIPPKEMFAWTPWKYLPGFEERMDERRRAFLMWRSLPMMRRYLEGNRRAKSAGSAGYREPNLLQKTVSAAFSKPAPHASGTTVPPVNPNKTAG
jgi:hypothetical protein